MPRSPDHSPQLEDRIAPPAGKSRRGRATWLVALGAVVVLAVVSFLALNREDDVSPSPAPPAATPGPSVATVPAAWPGASNTGVPAGTALTAYGGSCTISEAGTTIDSKTVSCPSGLSIQAANVTITKSDVTGLIRLDPDQSEYDGTWSLTFTDSEVDAGNIQQAAVCCGNVDILRSEMHGGQTGVQCEVAKFCRVRDSWLHDQYRTTSNWHLGGFLSDGTAGASCTGVGGNGLCIELTHNTIHCDAPRNGNADHGCSGDLQLIPNFAHIQKVRIQNNFLGANVDSAYCTFGGDKSDSPYPRASDVVYQDNVFARGTNKKCAAFGPVTDFNAGGTGNAWTNNRYDDGVIIPAP
jgi:hypothetical protein